MKSKMEGRRILVAGASGFIGSHLCDRLLAEGCHVTGVDNLATGRVANLSEALKHNRFRFVIHDVIEPFEGHYDRIYNLACPASPVHYQADPIATARTSFLGTSNLLELATACGGRFLLASTSEIYGDPLEHPQKETYRGNVNTIGPRACYDEGKRIAETLAFDYHRKHGTDIRIARIFNTYGPRMRSDDGRVVSNFVVQALSAGDITIYGDGSQTRSFCYIDDMTSGLIALMENEVIFGPVNLGNPGEFTIRELAEKILDKTGSGSRVVEVPLPEDDPQLRRPDISLARSALGWSPSIDLDRGLDMTIAHFRTVLAEAGQ